MSSDRQNVPSSLLAHKSQCVYEGIKVLVTQWLLNIFNNHQTDHMSKGPMLAVNGEAVMLLYKGDTHTLNFIRGKKITPLKTMKKWTPLFFS